MKIGSTNNLLQFAVNYFAKMGRVQKSIEWPDRKISKSLSITYAEFLFVIK